MAGFTPYSRGLFSKFNNSQWTPPPDPNSMSNAAALGGYQNATPWQSTASQSYAPIYAPPPLTTAPAPAPAPSPTTPSMSMKDLGAFGAGLLDQAQSKPAPMQAFTPPPIYGQFGQMGKFNPFMTSGGPVSPRRGWIG